MTTDLSDRTRDIVAETLPLMARHRAPLEKALRDHMLREDIDDPSAARIAVMTQAIMDMLYDHARQLRGYGIPAATPETAARHRALALGTAQYSRFGDALKPVMRDMLGSSATPSMLSAWSDAYWAIVRTVLREETRLAA